MREQKQQEIDSLKDSFVKSESVILADYCGLTVSEMQDVRTKLRDASVELRVAKNTLAKRAIKDTDSESLSDVFTGPTAIAFSYADPVAGAKVLSELVERYEALELKGGVLGNKLLSIADILALSKLPTKEILLSQLLSVMNGPMTGFVRVLSGNQRSLVQVLSAIKDTKENA
ncbi:MAG: 50S ribosomal protein L10 [bacterium]|nr:50S ribosomal protein L10 [bacterium]